MVASPARSPQTARALLCAAAGGACAALIDFARVAPQLGRTLQGAGAYLRALLFQATLYGSAAALLGLALGLAVALLVRFGALGPLLRRGAAPPPTTGLTGLLLAGLVGAAALGGMLHGPALFALTRFHHRGLIALLVGAEAALLALPAAGLALLALRPLRRLGRRRVPLTPPGAFVLYGAGLLLGLALLAGTTAALLLYLQQHPRMNPRLRAQNLALLTPFLALLTLFLGHRAGRALCRTPLLRRPPRVQAAALLPFFVLPPALLAFWGRDTLRVLDLRPLTTGACAALAALLARSALPRRPRLLPALLLLPLLWAATLATGRSDRVRKAVLAQSPLAGPLLGAMQAALDLDRDGAPSRWLVGGTDCDDLDPQVRPGAFDWPDDGIDQDCNGHQARLAADPAPPWPAPPPGLPARPNLVLITVDALRADHVGAYGYPRPTTPAIDALAREGLLFQSGYAHAPSTRYSVPAILTGRYPSTLAWGPPSQHWPPEVLPENRLLSEMLKGRGYRTCALLSYHYFEPTWGLARGFDDYDVHLMTLHSMGGDPAATNGSSARELADLALQKLPGLLAQAPFFLWIHFYDPHFRYQHHPGLPAFGDGTREQDQYDNEIRYTDGHIGRVLQGLRDAGLWDRTIVALTADHGEGFGEHGIPPDRRHGYHLYRDQTQVPLLLRAPGLAPRVIREPAGHVDLIPTLLNLLGVPQSAEPQLLGRSLVPLLTLPPGAPPQPGYQVFQEVMYEGPTTRKALVRGRWHYIRNVIPDGTSELYDLQADPGEERDQQGSPLAASAEAELSRALSAWMDQSALPPDFARKIAGNLSAGPLAAAQPLGVRIGDAIEVVGVDPPPGPVTRGGSFEVGVVLRVLRKVEPGWRLFFHIKSASGTFLNADHEPLQGLIPLQQLRPGQHLRDITRVSLPQSFPPGPLYIDLGLWRRSERAPVRGPERALDPTRTAARVLTLEVR